MSPLIVQIVQGLAGALLAGALIGAERTFHGRAGFRTHALVALAAAAAVMAGTGDASAMSRLGQGVITGVGFVGAGVIFKEGVSVQGLTTAASVLATAAIGILFGMGRVEGAAAATAAVLVVLILMRWIEDAMPTRVYAWSVFRFAAEAAPDKAGLDALLARHGVTLREVSYCRTDGGTVMEFRGVVAVSTDRGLDDLAAALQRSDGLKEFDLSRISK